MAGYRLRIKDSVDKDLRGVPAADLRRIMQRIAQLADNPRPSGAERLTGDHRYRIRQGDYRILYEVQDVEITVVVVKVGHRRDVYRN